MTSLRLGDGLSASGCTVGPPYNARQWAIGNICWEICYGYLTDVTPSCEIQLDASDARPETSEAVDVNFRKRTASVASVSVTEPSSTDWHAPDGRLRGARNPAKWPAAAV